MVKKTKRPKSNKFVKLLGLTLGYSVGLLIACYLILSFIPRTNTLPNQNEALTWSRERILASTENTYQYLEATTKLMYEEVPESYTHPYTTSKSIKQDFGNILRQNTLRQELDVIYQGMTALKRRTKPLSLILIADYHPNTMAMIQDERSLKCQIWIATLVQENQPALVFIEGFSGEKTWETWFKAVQKAEKKQLSPTPQRITVFRDQMWNDGIYFWYEPTLGDSKTRLFGYDSDEFIHLFELFALVEMQNIPIPASLANAESWTGIYDILQHYREQIILARCILEMEKLDVDSAYIVLGYDHIKTLPSLCDSWGVRLTVLTPPQ